MKTGDIYQWRTKKARGHDSRKKYHVFVINHKNKNVFLFINSVNYFGEGFELKKENYSFFSKDVR